MIITSPNNLSGRSNNNNKLNSIKDDVKMMTHDYSGVKRVHMERHDPPPGINKAMTPTIPNHHSKPLCQNKNAMKTKNPLPNLNATPGSGGDRDALSAKRYQAQGKIEDSF
jgi:hypothetical protein